MNIKSTLVAIAKYVSYTAVARLVPSQYWAGTAHFIARLYSVLRPGLRRSHGRQMAAIFDRPFNDEEVSRIETERAANAFAVAVATMGQRFAKGTDLEIRLTGADHISAALEDGQGAILWVCPFSWSFLVPKMALHRAGFSVSHLSRDTHGFGDSGVAMSSLNPLWIDGEALYLKERLEITDGTEMSALRGLHQRLHDNGIVSISFGNQGRKLLSAPFLEGIMTVAAGALSLSLSTGAPILPIYTLGDASNGFDVILDRPLDPGVIGNRKTRMDHLLVDMARRMEPLVKANPEKLQSWQYFKPPA